MKALYEFLVKQHVTDTDIILYELCIHKLHNSMWLLIDDMEKWEYFVNHTNKRGYKPYISSFIKATTDNFNKNENVNILVRFLKNANEWTIYNGGSIDNNILTKYFKLSTKLMDIDDFEKQYKK